MKHTLWLLASVAALCIGIAVSIGSAMHESLTFDEIVHVQEGLNAWRKKEFFIDTNNPPFIREFAVLPLLFTGYDMAKDGVSATSVMNARYMILILAVFLGIGIWQATRIFFGIEAGFIALVFYLFDPNMLAHNHYVSQDLGATLFFFLAYLSLVALFRNPSRRMFLIHGACIGFMAATKITLIPFYVVSALAYVAYARGGSFVSWIPAHALKIATSIFLCLAVIWSTYFFQTDIIILKNSNSGRLSETVRKYGQKNNNFVVLNVLNFLEQTPVPLGGYIAVLKNTFVRSTRPVQTFFLGKQYSYPKRYFMALTLLYKTPIILLVLFVFGLWIGSKQIRWKKILHMLAIPIGSIVIVSLLFPLQPLLRYMLPLYPFIYMIVAFGISHQKLRMFKLAGYMLMLWYVAGTLMQYPHFISYANEFAGPKNSRYMKFIDSNMDWGQGLITLSEYIQKEKPSHIQFSYFGRDDATAYGFPSNQEFGSHKSNEICGFHDVLYPEYSGKNLSIISVTNWYECGYSKRYAFSPVFLETVIDNMFMVFPLGQKQEIYNERQIDEK